MRQVKIRVLTLTTAKKDEKNKTYRRSDFEDFKITRDWQEGKWDLPREWHFGTNILQLEEQVFRYDILWYHPLISGKKSAKHFDWLVIKNSIFHYVGIIGQVVPFSSDWNWPLLRCKLQVNNWGVKPRIQRALLEVSVCDELVCGDERFFRCFFSRTYELLPNDKLRKDAVNVH